MEKLSSLGHLHLRLCLAKFAHCPNDKNPHFSFSMLTANNTYATPKIS